MAWEFELTDLNGTAVGLVRPRSAKVTRNLNAASTIEAEIDAFTPLAQPTTFFDPFDYEAGVTLQAAAPTVWQSTAWGDPDVFVEGEGLLHTNRGDGGWAGATTLRSYGDADVTLKVATAPTVNGSVELYALQSMDDFEMAAVATDANTSTLRLYQVAPGGAYTALASMTFTLTDGDRLTLRVEGSTLKALVNDVIMLTASHTISRSTGLAGFDFNDAPARLDSFIVRPAATATPSPLPALTTAALVRGWRTPSGGGARALRAVGKIKAGMQLSAARDSLDLLSIQATDGYGVLADRLTDNSFVFTAETPRGILADLLTDQNLRAWIGLDLDLADGGPPRDRNYGRGKNVAEIVKQLAEVDDGYYFRVDPVDLEIEPITGNPFFYRLMLLHPAPGTESAASFEYGEGTAANLSRVQVDVRQPINYVTAFGAGDGDEQLIATASDAASIEAFGLYDGSASFSDVIDQATLDQHALDMLRPQERRTFKVEVAAPTGNGELNVPSPWDDFDVGDTVRLNIRTSALAYTGRALVKSFAVSVDANGVERLASIDFQEDD